MLTICGKVTSQASSLFEESLPLLPLLLEMKTACVHSPLKPTYATPIWVMELVSNFSSFTEDPRQMPWFSRRAQLRGCG